MDQIIANAIHNFLADQLHDLDEKTSARHFFRLDGFDEQTYQKLLERFENDKTITGRPLSIHTVAQIPGFEAYALDADKSATWYRNHVRPGHVLLLIFNRQTSDAQSLKDIYPITEGGLSLEGVNHLIEAAFTAYQLKPKQIEILKEFLARFGKSCAQPQLRDLVAYLCEVNDYLKQHPVDSIDSAIAHALPQLGLFRSQDLANVLNSAKGDRLLGHIFKAARLGHETIPESDLNRKYLPQLKKAEFYNDPAGGLSPDDKSHLLHRFLTKVITDRNELLNVLRLDWSEVAPILHKSRRGNKKERYQEMGSALEEAFGEQQLKLKQLPEFTRHAVQDLREGKEPQTEDITELLDDYGDSLPKSLHTKLRRLVRTVKHQTTDFIAGVTYLALELLANEEVEEGSVLHVAFRDVQAKKDTNEKEALEAFRLLYGGLTKAMPAVSWDLYSLWNRLDQMSGQDEDSDAKKAKKAEKVHFSFRVSLRRATSQPTTNQNHAELIWLYHPDGPAAATLAHLQAEVSRLCLLPKPKAGLARRLLTPRLAPLSIPIYNTCPEADNVGDIDLSRPVHTLGAWYAKEATNLRQLLQEELKPMMAAQSWQKLYADLGRLEKEWTDFINRALKGVLAANINQLLAAYNKLLESAVTHLQHDQEAFYAFRLLTQAWIVGCEPFEEWAVVPFLHPLKLHWWSERTQHFNRFIAQLLAPANKVSIVDVKRFKQELSAAYGSAGYPALLSLPRRDQTPEYFLPVHEVEGYELYHPLQQAGIAYGLDPELVSEQEGKEAAQIAARELARVVEDYLETYPFVRDGLEIYLVQCRNGALPRLLVKELQNKRQEKGLHLNLIVHSTDRAAPLYQRITEWLKNNEEITQPAKDSYFPAIALKVQQSSYEELFEQLGHTDLVILPDVLAEKGQQIEYRELKGERVPLEGYLPIYQVKSAPFKQKELTRNLLLTPSKRPDLLKHFYHMQWAAKERQAVRQNKEIGLHLRVTLQEWETPLAHFHRHFNWVICYDTAVDRFLLEATIPQAVEVIRYSRGLGAKSRHNLTVSSAKRSQDIVVRRLTTNLEKILKGTSPPFRKQVAERLVEEAKEVSGDIVLRAAGPGAYLNELIGMVVAKYHTEQRYLATHPAALITWIYLDDFTHWFQRKFPDLLFVAILPDSDRNGELRVHIEILETKCISQDNLSKEGTDAERQVVQGINRLAQAWQPGKQHLDAPYWYDQLYQAVIGNLVVERAQEPLWQAFRRRVPEGDFTLEMSGHAWLFCHDGDAGIKELMAEGAASIKAPNAKAIEHLYHHQGRRGLRDSLQELLESSQIEIPEEKNANIPDLSQLDLSAPREAPISPPESPAPTSSEVSKEVNILPSMVTPPTAIPAPSASPALEEAQAHFPSDEGNWLTEKAGELTRALRNYDISVFPIEATQADVGPSVVRFKVRLRPGEKINRLQSIATDLQRELALEYVPLIENVRGTNFVGIDLPRPESESVFLLEALDELPEATIGELFIPVGKSPAGETITADLAAFPHLLVSGSTGSGKTIFLYGLVASLIHQFGPEQLSLLLIDPKQTDFIFFEDLPHLLGGEVIIEPEEAIALLEQLKSEELKARSKQLRKARKRDLKEYNQHHPNAPMKPIVVVIDEYADLVQVLDKKERKEFERSLIRLAQRARNVGIHLVIATQRPSADIVTSKLKTNLPTRIGFRLPSYRDSMTILDEAGAEKLLGKGDMLYKQGSALERLQGFYISTEELEELCTRIEGSKGAAIK